MSCYNTLLRGDYCMRLRKTGVPGGKSVHACAAMVLSCMDYRFWESVSEFVRTKLGIPHFDLVTVAGAAKPINDSGCSGLAGSCVDVACNLHGVQKIIIVNHKDCGAYGGSRNFKNSEEEDRHHHEELRKAKRIISEKHPDKEVIIGYADLSSDGTPKIIVL